MFRQAFCIFVPMDIETAKKAAQLLEEIEQIEKYKQILDDTSTGRSVAHFEFCLNYGDRSPRIIFEDKYTKKFIPIVEEILRELNLELSEL